MSNKLARVKAGEINVPALIASLERGLAEARTFAQVKKIRDEAAALQVFLRSQEAAAEVVNRAGEWKLRAERRLGEELAKVEKNGGRLRRGNTTLPRDETPRLSDIGVSKIQASRWQRLAAVPAEKFESFVGTAERVTLEAALKLNGHEEKKTRRAERERELAEATHAAAKSLGRKRYGVIYADPPWSFEPYSRETGMDRAADNHYPTMDLDAIKALQPPAAKDCVLFLWATAPMLPEALDLMTAWGFTYRSHVVWIKDKLGTGYWFRNQHELLLVGVRGNVPAPAPGQQYPSIIEAKRLRHSAKPSHFAEIIEEMFPTLPRLEMFGRSRRAGWDVWGNEA